MNVVFQNEAFVVLNKEAGCPVFPFHKGKKSISVLSEILRFCPEQKNYDWESGFEGGIAHRLDVSTSGAVWIARTPQNLEQLRVLFAQKKLTKQYFFLTRKKVSWKHHRINAPIAHDRKKRSRMVVQRGKNTAHRGKWYSAQTEFSFLTHVEQGSLWRASMTSGVMHQIRIHAAFAGIALAGDRLYGGGSSLQGWNIDFALHHCFMTGKRLPLSVAPLPDYWPSEAQVCLDEITTKQLDLE